MPLFQAIPFIAPSREVASKPLVSNTSIFILSAFVVGMVSGRAVHPSLELPMLAGGMVGIFAYIALERLARRRQEKAAQFACERAVVNLERRIDRHIPRSDMHAMRRRRPFPVPGSEEQYLTVTTARRPWVY